MAGFTITEEDIDAYILYCKHEENLTVGREEAREKLQELLDGITSLAESDPAKLLEMQKKLDKFKRR